MQNESISLYYSEGSSDKIYCADLVEVEGGYLVNFRYGRRGSALTAGTKTKDPLPYDKAKKVYDKLVAEKMGKGYTTGESGTAYQDTPKEAQFTGILPQLLNAVDEADLERLFRDGEWCMQEKHDGERRLVSNVGGDWFGINRKGMRVSLPLPLVEALSCLPAGTVLDGEIIGEIYYPFDLLEHDGKDWRSEGYFKRYSVLQQALSRIPSSPNIKLVTVHGFEDQKRQVFELVKNAKGEGVVFKRWQAAHSVGRPNSGGDHLKFKFVESATLFVYSQNTTKRSVQVAAFDQDGNEVLLGNVTVPPNHEVPEVGAVVEVEYLYAFENGSIYQPVYRGKRVDQSMDDCKVSQIKYKPMQEAA